MLKLILISLALLIANGFSFKGPHNKSLRALSMGNAFVAVAEDHNSIYYNPAGLNYMNKLGNYKKRPDLGYYPDNWLDMRIAFGFVLPDLLKIGLEAKNVYDDHQNTFTDIAGADPDASAQAFADDSTLYNDILFIDGLNIPLGTKLDMELAMHNFGGAIWLDVGIAPYLDAGIIVPSAGTQYARATLGAQTAIAYEVHPKVAIGLGYKMIISKDIGELNINIGNMDTVQTEVQDKAQNEMDTLFTDLSSGKIDMAFDFGAMYQFKRTLRFGMAVQDLYVDGLNGEKVTPELTMGMVWSPRKFQRNTAFFRKVNIAADLEDLLNDDRNYRFFSKVNFGMEYEQVILAIPSLTLGSNWRFVKLRLAGGFKGGYWSAGAGLEVLRFVEIEFASWAEEKGYFTGQEEDRHFVMEISLGI